MYWKAYRTACAWGSLCLALATTQAQAQFYSPASCNCAPQVCQPVCEPVYQTVPVTEYQQVTETVRKPIIETEYVEEPVTAYRPVTEQRTVAVPTVSYQNVTEYQTVQKNCGYWQTNYQPIAKCSPCQYDNRPGIMGWMNRTGYSFRQSFTPKYTVQRQYVPRMVAQTIPVTRQVATRSERQVTYNVTKMVPYQTTRKVAVNKVRYVDQKVTAMRPVTVMRSVPIGTRMTYGTPVIGGTRTTLAPVPDSVGGSRNANNGRTDRTAERNDPFESNDETVIPGRQFRRQPVDSSLREGDARRSSYEAPVIKEPKRTPSAVQPKAPQASPTVAGRTNSVPSIVRVSGWAARSPRSRGPSSGPSLTPPSVALLEDSP